MNFGDTVIALLVALAVWRWIDGLRTIFLLWRRSGKHGEPEYVTLRWKLDGEYGMYPDGAQTRVFDVEAVVMESADSAAG